MSDLELARYQQVQITAYRDRGSSVDKKAGVAVRDVEIGVVNRHTQAERTVRYREQVALGRGSQDLVDDGRVAGFVGRALKEGSSPACRGGRIRGVLRRRGHWATIPAPFPQP